METSSRTGATIHVMSTLALVNAMRELVARYQQRAR